MTNNPPIETFRRFSLLSALDDGLYHRLCRHITIKKAKAGTVLFSQGDKDTDDYFLVTGSIKLGNTDNINKTLEAGLPNSNHPISPKRPRQQTAAAITDIEYFTLGHSVVNELLENRKRQSDSYTFMANNKSDDSNKALFKQFQHELSRGYFVIPSFPETALKIRDTIDQAECDINQVVNLAHSDPGISSKLIRTVNSVLYKGVSHCDNLTTAVMRLGLATTKQLVTSFAILGLFDSNSRLLKQQMEQARKDSINIASHAFVLAEHIKSLNSEEALLAGLLHQIGKIIILNYAEQFHEFDNNPTLLAQAVEQFSNEAGKLAAQEWQFSPAMINVIAESNDPQRSTNTAIDYCDLIIVCRQLANNNDVDPDNEAWQKVERSLEPNTNLTTLLSDKQSRLLNVKSLLSN